MLFYKRHLKYHKNKRLESRALTISKSNCQDSGFSADHKECSGGPGDCEVTTKSSSLGDTGTRRLSGCFLGTGSGSCRNSG